MTAMVEARTADWRRYFPGAEQGAHEGRGRHGQELSGGEMVVEFMRLVGVEVIFGIPGGASLPLTDALTAGHMVGAFRYLLTGHEQGAGFEAEGYAEASGRCGFCTATSGPGATNLITALADATRDSRPIFALTGNTATTAEPEAFQALDIVAITHGRATKASYRPERAGEVQLALVRAYHTVMTGRPGAVLVDLPKDVQSGRATLQPWEDLLGLFDWAPVAPDAGAIAALAALLAGAERPVLYAGHGVALSGAWEELRELSRRLDVPVVTTVHGLGLLPADEPRNLGMVGMHGSMAANLAPYLADVVVALGARFDDRVVGARPEAFAPRARLAHIDADPAQLNRVRGVELAIHADVRLALRALLDATTGVQRGDRAGWLAELAAIAGAMPIQSYDDPGGSELSHEWVYAEAARALDASGATDVVATFDVGTHQMKGAQWFRARQPRSWISSGGMGSMGCALPMAVGAHLARPGARVLACCGDGGFVMSSHELDTIGAYRLPVIVLLFDDSALGMVGNWHGLYFGGRNLTSDRRRGRGRGVVDITELKARLAAAVDAAETADDLTAALCDATTRLAEGEWPLFAATAAGYGIPASRVHTKAQFAEAMGRAMASSGPSLIQVMLPRQAQVYPLMEPGTTPQEMVWRESSPGSGEQVYARERFDYERRLLY